MNPGPEGPGRPPGFEAQPDPGSAAAGEGAAGTPGAGGTDEESLRAAAASGEQRLREAGEEARVVAERAVDHLREYTKENPLAAAGIAFAAGVILSRLFSR